MGKAIRQGAICFCLVSTVTLTACAGSSSPAAGAPQTVMVSAASKSEAASTFHVSATEEMSSLSGTPFIAATSATLSGDVDLSVGASHLSGTLLGPPTSPGAAPETLSFAVIQIGTDHWESTSGLGGLFGTSLPPGHWIKSDSPSTDSQFPDPRKLFDALRSQATTVRFVGTGSVDGVSADRYQLTGPSSLFDALGGGPSDQSQTAGPITVSVWVDRSSLVRRLSTTLQENMGPPGQMESVAVQVDFTHYGEPVHIEPPPADLVVPGP